MNISITGDLGSGKSSISAELTKKGFSYVSVGGIFRDLATKKGITVLQLNEQAKLDSTIDAYVDNRQMFLGEKRTKAIFDSRLGWYFVPNSFKVYVTVDLDESAKRICSDTLRKAETHTSIAETKQSILLRQELERTRYIQKYGVDYLDLNNYDLIIDSTNASPKEVAGEILRMYVKHTQNDNKKKAMCLSPYRIYPTQCIRDLSEDRLKHYLKLFSGKQNYVSDEITVTHYNNFNFVIDGHHRLLAALKLKKKFIYVNIASDCVSNYSKSKCYDFEDIAGFTYSKYPE